MSGKNEVLIDTSAWIAYFRQTNLSIVRVVDESITDDRARICDVVVAELIQGAKSSKEVAALIKVGETIRQLTGATGIWARAGKLAFDLRQQGKTIHMIDCYLAQLASENNSDLLSLDKHFGVISSTKFLDLRLVDL